MIIVDLQNYLWFIVTVLVLSDNIAGHQWRRHYTYGIWLKVQSAKLRHKGKSSPVVLFRAQAFYIIFTPKELRGHCCKHFLLWCGLGGFHQYLWYFLVLHNPYSLILLPNSLGYNKNDNIMCIPKFNYVCQLITVSVMQIENQWLQPRVGPALISIDRHKFCWPDSLILFKFCVDASIICLV